MVPPRHQLQRKRQNIYDSFQKSIDNFNLIIVNPSPKLTYQENLNIVTSFGTSSRCQCIETNTKRIVTPVLKGCNENKSIAHTSTCALTIAETVAMKIYSIELK